MKSSRGAARKTEELAVDFTPTVHSKGKGRLVTYSTRRFAESSDRVGSADATAFPTGERAGVPIWSVSDMGDSARDRAV
ncbi:MAG TPA: hypothetical protein VM848_14265 [Acidimicrobiia bacterium]|nr:hypothetical protein [Acidimicrobiia bacterium]